MSEDRGRTSLNKVSTFSGREEDFPQWWLGFYTHASVIGAAEALDDDFSLVLPTDCYSERLMDDEIKAVKMNAKVVNSFVACFSKSATLMKIIAYAQDSGCRVGRAWKIKARLFQKFSPDDSIAALQLEDELNKLKFDAGRNAMYDLFEKTSALQLRFPMHCTDDKLEVAIMKTLPIEYRACAANAKRVHSITSNEPYTFARFEDAITTFHRQIRGFDSSESNNDNIEAVLSTITFNGHCNLCKNYGHKEVDCKARDLINPDYAKKPKKKKCSHCNKRGHTAEKCWKLHPELKPSSTEKSTAFTCIESDSPFDMVLCSFTSTTDCLMNEEIWICDSGCMNNITGYQRKLTNLRKAPEGDLMSASGSMSVTSIGDLTCYPAYGNPILLTEVRYSPSCPFNLFSATKATNIGWRLSGNKDGYVFKKGEVEIEFNLKVKTENGILWCKRLPRNKSEIAAVVTGSVSVNRLHNMLGHINEISCRAIAKHLNIQISKGPLTVCESCAIGKAKQKPLRKNKGHSKASKANERVFIDILPFKQPSDIEDKLRNLNWLICVDEFSGLILSSFHEKKSSIGKALCNYWTDSKAKDKPVVRVRLDNSGENKALETLANGSQFALGIHFEFTARRTPQQNSLAERGFTTILFRAKAIMHAAHLSHYWKYFLRNEVFMYASMMHGLEMVERNKIIKSRYEHHSDALPAWAKTGNLKAFGEAGVVKSILPTDAKLNYRGTKYMFIGYSIKHSGDTVRMFCVEKKSVIVTRDIVWLNKMYFSDLTEESASDDRVPVIEDSVSVTDDVDKDNDVEADREQGNSSDQANRLSSVTPAVVTRSGRRVVLPARYHDNDDNDVAATVANNYYTQLMLHDLTSTEVCLVGAGIGGGYFNTNELHTMTYKEGMASDERDEWKEAIDKEWNQLDQRVWKYVNRDQVPAGTTMLDSVWVLKKKSNGKKKARLNARGFKQIDGKHFDSSNISSPTVSEVSIRVILTLALMANWAIHVVDIQGAFLHGEFNDDENLFMEIPEGFKESCPTDKVLLLLRTIYGLKQAAKAFWKFLLKLMESIGCYKSNVDNCVYYKWDDTGLSLLASWVDDLIVAGKEDTVSYQKSKLKEMVPIDDCGSMDEYVGCKVDIDRVERKLKFTQPVMIQSFQDEFDLPDKSPITPAVPNTSLSHVGDIISNTMMSYYRKGVGKLLHMCRFTRPSIQNAVRDLSRRVKGATLDHVHAMHRVMNYCVTTKDKGWVLRPNRTWDGKDKSFEFVLEGKSDSDYAVCQETRRSVTGYVGYLEGSLVVARSVMQKRSALSTTEAELYALVSCVQDLIYVKQLLGSMGLTVKTPIIVKVDNKGTVDLANGWSTGGNLKHVEVRQFFIRDLREEGVLRVDWIPGTENESDILTKNTTGQVFQKHVSLLED